MASSDRHRQLDDQHIELIDRYDAQDGYYIMYRSDWTLMSPRKLVIFIHGYGALNPAIYGKWIRHIIKDGSVVIYPRYQKNIFSPSPNLFDQTIISGVHSALSHIKDSLHLQIEHQAHYIGHSYGGVAVLYLLANRDAHTLPRAASALICQPGTGMFKGLVLDDYSGISPSTRMAFITTEQDQVVGDKITVSAVNDLRQHPNVIWFKFYSDHYEDVVLKADHRSPYAIDEVFDNGYMNVTARRAWRTAQFDIEDQKGFFIIWDTVISPSAFKALLIQQKSTWSLGYWPDGRFINPIKLIYP